MAAGRAEKCLPKCSSNESARAIVVEPSEGSMGFITDIRFCQTVDHPISSRSAEYSPVTLAEQASLK
jgi:hypothetical protein